MPWSDCEMLDIAAIRKEVVGQVCWPEPGYIGQHKYTCTYYTPGNIDTAHVQYRDTLYVDTTAFHTTYRAMSLTRWRDHMKNGIKPPLWALLGEDR